MNACGHEFGEHRADACGFCGSITPTKLVKALESGNHVSWADWKYGWPHKMYLERAFEGHHKFYTVHLQDATEEEKKTIEKAIGLEFTFTEDRVHWKPLT